MRELGPATWTDFARVVEKHNGIWGGCWCLAFHISSRGPDRTPEQNRAQKEELVRSNRSQAALVCEGPEIAGWCQFGSPLELPARMTGYRKLGLEPPDWRITCFFVDRDHRRAGVARSALKGASGMIATRGGGVVDGYPNDPRGRSTSSSFLGSGTVSMFTDAGFSAAGWLGQSRALMRRSV